MWNRTSIAAFTCALLCIVAEGWAKDHGDAVTPESLLFQEIDIVYTATRTERSVREVPSAVTIIAAEEISTRTSRDASHPYSGRGAHNLRWVRTLAPAPVRG